MSIQRPSLALRRQFVQYSPDGKGRDLYISSNSGGFCNTYKHKLEIKETYPTIVKFGFPNIKIHTAPLVYRSDGSGRDSYILREAGGLREDIKTLSSYQLKDFLRTPSEHIYNYIENSRNKQIKWVGKKEILENRKKKEVTKNFIRRLYNEGLEKYKDRLKKEETEDNDYYSKPTNKYPFHKTFAELRSHDFNYFLRKNENNHLLFERQKPGYEEKMKEDEKEKYKKGKEYFDNINKRVLYHSLSKDKFQNKSSFLNKKNIEEDPLVIVDQYMKRREIFG